MNGYHKYVRPPTPYPAAYYPQHPRPNPCWCYEGPTGPTGPAGGLQNLIDGNAPGSVRGIHTRDDYQMGENAFAIGTATAASGDNSFAQGIRSEASGGASSAQGYETVSSALASHAEGNGSAATGEAAHAEGGSRASGFYSHAEGLQTWAQGEASHAEGNRSTASGDAAHTEGVQAVASGENAHAEGNMTLASGFTAHAEGIQTEASGYCAHAEGDETLAGGSFTHAEGISTQSLGIATHAEGILTSATGNYSHAEGAATSTNGYFGAHIMGSYGRAEAPYSWFLANGQNELNQGLAAKILYTGDAYIDNAWNGGGADYAELYETESGQSIEPGFFVTFAGAGKKIRLAQSYDKYILGVVSAAPGFVAGGGDLRWKNKFKTDAWGRVLFEDIAVPETKDKQGNIISPARVESRPVLNPAYDPGRAYVPRQNRPEWVKVGLLGMLRVRDDGTLIPGGYCLPGTNGIATAAHEGYRVLERTGPDQALILFR